MMGPSRDDTGFEQGGINSGDYYKLYNNVQLIDAQDSQLGVDIGSSTISAVGQADDVMLVANNLNDLRLLVTLTERYCSKYRVKLEPAKTKLLAFHNKCHALQVKHAVSTNPILINNVPVKLSQEAEHVGVMRNIQGNLPNIILRVANHKKILGALLSTGMARGHRGNPAASLRIHQLYCTPVLFSGLASLYLSKPEIKIIDQHYQITLQNIQRLHPMTPRSIVLFLAGSLPGEALLHLRQLSLFTMICHLPEDPLHSHARFALTVLGASANSWFGQIKKLCMQYELPHPMVLLEDPPSKPVLKKRIKLKVLEYWHKLLAEECTSLDSLLYFDPYRSSLVHPQPLWTASAGNSYECSKSMIQARMVSGRYRTEMMCRFWSSNRMGYCLAETCHEVPGTLEHLLVQCPALEGVRSRLLTLFSTKTIGLPALHHLVMKKVLSSPATHQVKFMLDASADIEVLHLVQLHGQQVLDLVLYLTRTWAYCIHREKMIITGRWPGKLSPLPATPHPIKNSLTNTYTITGEAVLTNHLTESGHYENSAQSPSERPLMPPAVVVMQVHDEADQSQALLPGLGAASDVVSGIPSHSRAGLVTDQSWRGTGGVSAVTQWECDSSTATLCL